MANTDINFERFAHDVCVHVLEKFAIFKAPDDTRKQNTYTSYDFLPWVSRSVVSNSIWLRDNFRNALEEKYKTTDPANQEKIWNFFDEYLLQNEIFVGKNCTGKVCLSLALCTEYVQFVSTKDFTVSLNKLVIRWSDFFEKNLKVNFEAEGGFSKLYSNIKSCQVDRLDNFHRDFISEYCIPYGARECSLELAKQCAEKHGIQLDIACFGVNTIDFNEDSFVKMSEGTASKLPESMKPKPKEMGSDSEDSGSSTQTSEKTDSEMSRNLGSEASDSEISQNNLLGIPPHEDVLREIDPFFVENIPSPPKPSSTSKSSQRQTDPSEIHPFEKNSLISKSPLIQPDWSSISPLDSKSPVDDPSSSDKPISVSKSEEHLPDSSDTSESSSKSSGDTGSNDGPQSASKSLEPKPESSVLPESDLKFPKGEAESSDSRPSALKSEGKPHSSVASESLSKSPKDELGLSDNSQSDPEQEDLQEKVEQILSKMEHNMDALRVLLSEHGYLSMKSSQGKRRLQTEDKIPPKGLEGLI